MNGYKIKNRIEDRIENMKLGAKIRDALEGRTQRWLVIELIKSGVDITEVGLSNKLQGVRVFTPEELAGIQKLLNIGPDGEPLIKK